MRKNKVDEWGKSNLKKVVARTTYDTLKPLAHKREEPGLKAKIEFKNLWASAIEKE